jgi:hypothetical protein
MSPSLPFQIALPARRAADTRNVSPVPKLSTGDDLTAAQTLVRLYSESPDELRKIVAFGLTAWEIKENRLKHGEWGYWLAAHAPGLCRPDSITGHPKMCNQLIAHMKLTKNVLAGIGFPTIESYFRVTFKFPKTGKCAWGNFLLLPENEVPDEVRTLRQKIVALVDGKSRRQWACKSGQMADVAHGSFASQLVQLKDLTGNTCGHSALTAGLDGEELKLLQLERDMDFLHDSMLEIAEISNFAMMSDRVIKKFCDAAEAAAAFGRRILETRKGVCP